MTLSDVDIPRRFFEYKMSISWPVSAEASLGFSPFPCFLSCLLLAFKPLIVLTKPESSKILNPRLGFFAVNIILN